MNFNRFGNNLKRVFNENSKKFIDNIPTSLKTVSKMFEGYELSYRGDYLYKIDLGFRDYSRLFTHTQTKDWKKLYDFVMILWDKHETDICAIIDRPSCEKRLQGKENFNILNFPGYLEDGELYNRYTMCDVTGDPHEKLFTEFHLNENITRNTAYKYMEKFLNDYCKEEI